MRTFLFICVVIFSGIASAFLVGFQPESATQPLEYDDEQENLKNQIVIKVSHVVSENTPKGKAVRRFKNLVEKNTNGHVKVEIYPNGSLYSDINEWNALKNNNVQMIIPATSKISPYVPEFQVFDLPFAFNDYEQVEEAFTGKIGKTLLARLENQEGVKGLTFWYNGFKQITNNRRPLVSPGDFNRLHFRTMPGDIIQDQYQALGAATSSLPFNKTYENLQVGFIDGHENTISNIYSKKLFENQNYLTVSNHSYLGYVVVMNQEFWDKLPEVYQVEIEEALKQTTDWIRRHSIEINDQHMRELKLNTSLNIHILLDWEKEKWMENLKPIYDKYESVIGKELMKEVQRIRDS
ncbi:C4-dicarboxylate TRAP transporter substrate-binding protein DctB [Bacillus carboniphilus]|uniref:C4-dicarboxylate TRAP transporter substrate-binding protein DctB n=1 Tax=Bacillus carboniphilus TaxID=86663 RepID=A0ABN0VTA9_9BACI